jgi:hypothetical protein
MGKRHSVVGESARHATRTEMLTRLIEQAPWEWPRHPICFICEPHADAKTFMASLVAAGVINKTGPRDQNFVHNRHAREAKVLLGGDCFDKGSGVLRLLRAIRLVKDSGIGLSILAGSHDIRVLMGLAIDRSGAQSTKRALFRAYGSEIGPIAQRTRGRIPLGAEIHAGHTGHP